MNTAAELVTQAQGILEREVLVPIVLQKCAARGYTPKTEAELDVLLKTASDVRAQLAAGNLAPVPFSALNEDGTLTKQASAAIANDPFSYGDEMQVDLEKVSSAVKEAAAVLTWHSLEAIAASQQ